MTSCPPAPPSLLRVRGRVKAISLRGRALTTQVAPRPACVPPACHPRASRERQDLPWRTVSRWRPQAPNRSRPAVGLPRAGSIVLSVMWGHGCDADRGSPLFHVPQGGTHGPREVSGCFGSCTYASRAGSLAILCVVHRRETSFVRGAARGAVRPAAQHPLARHACWCTASMDGQPGQAAWGATPWTPSLRTAAHVLTFPGAPGVPPSPAPAGPCFAQDAQPVPRCDSKTPMLWAQGGQHSSGEVWARRLPPGHRGGYQAGRDSCPAEGTEVGVRVPQPIAVDSQLRSRSDIRTSRCRSILGLTIPVAGSWGGRGHPGPSLEELTEAVATHRPLGWSLTGSPHGPGKSGHGLRPCFPICSWGHGTGCRPIERDMLPRGHCWPHLHLKCGRCNRKACF